MPQMLRWCAMLLEVAGTAGMLSRDITGTGMMGSNREIIPT